MVNSVLQKSSFAPFAPPMLAVELRRKSLRPVKSTAWIGTPSEESSGNFMSAMKAAKLSDEERYADGASSVRAAERSIAIFLAACSDRSSSSSLPVSDRHLFRLLQLEDEEQALELESFWCLDELTAIVGDEDGVG